MRLRTVTRRRTVFFWFYLLSPGMPHIMDPWILIAINCFMFHFNCVCGSLPILCKLLCPRPRWCASDVCLSVAYIGPKSRTERPRKTKIGTEVAHVTCDSDTTSRSKGQRSTCRGGGILWRPPAQIVSAALATLMYLPVLHVYLTYL